MGHNRHCPGVKGCTGVTGESVDSLRNVDAGNVIGLGGRLIGAVMDEVVAAMSGVSID
jgi:hypothetical protein